jgi:hypothetical protein
MTPSIFLLGEVDAGAAVEPLDRGRGSFGRGYEIQCCRAQDCNHEQFHGITFLTRGCGNDHTFPGGRAFRRVPADPNTIDVTTT